LGFLPHEGLERWGPADIRGQLAGIGWQGVERSQHHFKHRGMSLVELKPLVATPADFVMQVGETYSAQW